MVESNVVWLTVIIRMQMNCVDHPRVNPVPRLNSRGFGEEPFGITTPFLPAPFQLVETGSAFTGGASPWYGVKTQSASNGDQR